MGMPNTGKPDLGLWAQDLVGLTRVTSAAVAYKL